jgi:hypothetical protein
LTNEDLDTFFEWRRKISEDTGIPMPVVLDPEEGVVAEMCASCDQILALVTVCEGGMSVDVTETEHGVAHRRAQWNLAAWVQCNAIIHTWHTHHVSRRLM